MRVLQIGSDRSKRGGLVRGTPAALRQEAYARSFGHVDDISFTRRSDDFRPFDGDTLSVHPTSSRSRLLYGLDALRIARRLKRPDVVSVQDPFEAGLLGFVLARKYGVPLHVQVHTSLFSPEYGKLSLLNRFRVLLARFVLPRAARVRVVSERIKRGIGSRIPTGAPITVLPIFVDTEKFKSAKADPQLAEKFSKFKTKLLVVSRLEPEKNVELAVRSFAEAAPQDACLVVVGEGSERERLQALARTLSISDRIFFEGERSAIEYYPVADLVLVPSKYEGYGLVIVEALAAGKPALSTDVGAAREAGAIISNEKEFAADLKKWFESGPREGILKNYPYKSFDDYVRAYCGDITACIKK